MVIVYRNFIFIISWTFIHTVEAFRAPSGLQAIVTSSNDIIVTWNEHKKWRNRDDCFYILRYKYSGVSNTLINLYNTSYTLQETVPNTTYIFSVRYTKGKRKTPWSPKVYNATAPILTVTVIPAKASHKPVPEPRSLKVKEITSSSAKVKWKRPRKMRRREILAYQIIWKERKTHSTHTRSRRERSHSSSMLNIEDFVIKNPRERETNTTRQYMIVTGLRPHTVYAVKVRTISVDGRISNSTRKVFKTERLIIDYPPSNITAHVISQTKIYITWTPPLVNTHLVTGYKIQYKRKRNKQRDVCSVNIGSHLLEYNITDLLKSESYKIRIAGKTQGRTGPFTPWKTVSLMSSDRSDLNSTDLGVLDAYDDDENVLNGVTFNIKSTIRTVNVSWSADWNINYTLKYVLQNDDGTDVLNVQTREVFSAAQGQGDAQGDALGDTLGEARSGYFVFYRLNASTWYRIHVMKTSELSVLTQGRTFRVRTLNDTVRDNIKTVDVTALSPFELEFSIRLISSNISDFLFWVELKDIQGDTNTPYTKHVIITNSTPVFTIDDLQPSTQYRGYVSMGHHDARCHMITIQTPHLLPLDRESAAVEPFNSTCLLVFWKTPEPSYSGHVSIEIIYHLAGLSRDVQRKSVPIAIEGTSISDLLPNSTYSIYLQMEGFDLQDAIDIEGTTFAAEVETEPTLPAPPADVFVQMTESFLNVSWLPPQPVFVSDVRWYQIEVFQDSMRWKLYRVKSNISALRVEPVDRASDYIIDVRSANTFGQSVAVRRTVHRVVETGQWYSVRSLQGSALSSRSILVEWLPPVSGDLTRYLIRYRPNIKVGLNSSDIIDQWVSRSHNNYVIANLEENEEYAISVIPYFNDVNGNTSTIKVFTYSDVPGAPPFNVTAKVINSTNVLVDWLPPPFAEWNGNLTGYVLMYGRRDSENVERVALQMFVNSYMITELQFSTVYQIAVAAVNSNGTGPSSDIILIQTGVNPVLVQSPEAPVNLTLASHEFGIHVAWSPPISDIPVNGYIVGYGRFIPEVYRYTIDASQSQYTLTGLRSGGTYIVSVRSFNHFGESRSVFKSGVAGITVEVSQTTQRQEAEENEETGDSPTGLKVRETGDEVISLRVSWKPPKILNGLMEGYLLYYTTNRPFSYEEANVVFVRSEFVLLKNLNFNTTYYFRVKVQYRDGFGSISRTVRFRTKPPDNSVHVMPKPTITSIMSGPDYLQITWLPPSSKNYYHVVRGYILGYGTEQANERQEILPAMITTHRISELSPNTTYHLSLRVFNALGDSEQTYINATTTIIK